MKRNIIIFIFLILIATSFKLRSKTQARILNPDSRVFIEQVTDPLTENKVRGRNFEDEIRNLESLEREAILKSDTVTLFQLWSEDLVINTADSKVRTISDLKETFRKGTANQASFSRVIEKIAISENVAVVMGHETQDGIGKSGSNLSGPYTDVWMKDGKTWKLTARQATNLLAGN